MRQQANGNDERHQRTAAGAAAVDAPVPLTGLQAEAWRLLWQQFLRDADALAECRIWEERRRRAAAELLRMSDLAALSPNLRFPLHIVAPRARLDKVRRELARPTFQALGLHRRCASFSGEALLDAADSIMRSANDPSAIERRAARADDVTSDPLRELDDARGAG